MDRIEELMKDAKPHLPEPGPSPGAFPDRSEMFSTDANLVHLAQHKQRRTVRTTAGVVLAAASVIGAVVVAGHLVPRSAPAPAVTSAPTASATSTPTVTPAEPTVPPAPEVIISPPSALQTPADPATAPVSPEETQLRTFTFPDGHISFELPAGWTVQTEPGPGSGSGYDAVNANIFDEIGNKVAFIGSGALSGTTSGPVNRTILDSGALDGFDNRDGASYFLFARDVNTFDASIATYFMGVVREQLMTVGPGSNSASSLLIMPNGGAGAYAHLDESMSPETVDAWMQTEQYSKLKALLTSVRYSW